MRLYKNTPVHLVETASPHPLNTVAWIHDASRGVPDTAFNADTPMILRNTHVQAKIRAASGSALVGATCETYGTRGITVTEWIPAGTSNPIRYPTGWSSVHIPPSATDRLADIVTAINVELQQNLLFPAEQPPALYTPNNPGALPAGVLWVPNPISQHFLIR